LCQTDAMLRRSRFLILVGLLAVSLVFAQAPVSSSNQDDSDLTTIEGFVVKSGTGERLGKAGVVLRPAGGSKTVFGPVAGVGGRRESVCRITEWEGVASEGTFVIENVSQTIHRVSITGLPDGAYVTAAHIGG